MDLAFALIALGSCVGCTFVGCRGHYAVKNLDARVVVIEKEKYEQQQMQQMKHLVHEAMASYRPPPISGAEQLPLPPIPHESLATSPSHPPVSDPPS